MLVIKIKSIKYNKVEKNSDLKIMKSFFKQLNWKMKSIENYLIIIIIIIIKEGSQIKSTKNNRRQSDKVKITAKNLR